MITQLLKIPSLWEILQGTKRPVVLYGMGNGGDKLLEACGAFGVEVSGVFASKGFVRGHSYRGFPVRTLEETAAELGEDIIILLAFASSRPEVLETIGDVAARYTLYAPDLPVCGAELFTRDYLRGRLADAQEVYHLLADEVSRQVYLDILRYKLTGSMDHLFRCETPRRDIWGDFFPLGKDAFYVDAGAYTGDTVEEFYSVYRERCSGVLALEPDGRNFKKLLATVDRLGLNNADCRNVGAWSQADTLPFAHKSGRQAALGERGTPTPVDSIDGLLAGRIPTLMKYDVEGAEEQALLGSAGVIREYGPGLIVSGYHRSGDLFDLPLLINRLRPSYRIHLRHHPYIPAWDTNFYVT